MKFRTKNITKKCTAFLLLWVFCIVKTDYAKATVVASKGYVDSAIMTVADVAEIISNKVISISGGGSGLTNLSTDMEYPSAKATYDELSIKMNKVPGASSGNIATFTSTGGVADSGQAPSNFQNIGNRLNGYLGSATTDQYYSAPAVNSISNTKVGLSGNETINGTKTFSTIPLIPTAALPSL